MLDPANVCNAVSLNKHSPHTTIAEHCIAAIGLNKQQEQLTTAERCTPTD